MGGLLAMPSKTQKITVFNLGSGIELEYAAGGSWIIDLKVDRLKQTGKLFAQVFPEREYVIYKAISSLSPALKSHLLERNFLFKTPWMFVEKRGDGAVFHVDGTYYRAIADEFGDDNC